MTKRETPIWRRYMRFLGSDPAADAQDELDFHLAMRVEDLVGRGLAEADARCQAEREFGDVQKVRAELEEAGRQRLRRGRRARTCDSLAFDLKLAARSLKRAPGFTAVVASTLALGIGGTTAVFSVVQAVLLSPLPYASPGQLVRFYQYGEGDDGEASFRDFLTGPHFQEIREHASFLTEAAALYTYRETGLDIAAGGRPERLRVLEVSSDYFRTLGTAPARGREFEREDEVGSSRVVLSHSVWSNRFATDPAIIGSTVLLGGEAYTVTGIAPAEFEDPIAGEVDAWLPLDLAEEDHVDVHSLTAIGRLGGGVSLEQARSEMAALNRSMAERWPEVAGDTVVMVSLKEDLVGGSRSTLRLLLIAVGLVLLVACVNVANLFLVRSAGRVREFAIRSAVGSGRGRIARQLLAESLLLAILGGALGVVLAGFGMAGLESLGRDAIDRVGEVGFHPWVLGFAVVLTLATGIGFGVAPAYHFARVDPARALRDQSRSATPGRSHMRLRSGLAVTQIALALTLSTAAGVLMLSLRQLQAVQLGFSPENVLTFEVALPSARYSAERRAAFQEELPRRLEAVPGVTAAGASSRLPATGSQHNWGTLLVSGPLAGGEEVWIGAEQRIVSGRFFEAMEIPLLAGRLFEERDDALAPPAAVVSAAFARTAFPGVPFAEVVGQRVAPIGEVREIIGVVGDVALAARGATEPTIYQAHRQYADDRNWSLSHVVSTELPPERILPTVRAVVAALDPELVVHRPVTVSTLVSQGMTRERFALVLMGCFAGVALVLACLGLYGVLSYGVSQRTQEIGVRIALGASGAQVRTLVLRQAAVVVGIGIVIGLLGALALGRWLSSLVYEISPREPSAFAATVVLLSVAALVAAWLPAWRASRVDPRVAMLSE